METSKISIKPKFFHLAIDTANFDLYDHMLDIVDETQIKNSDKLGLVMRFHYHNSRSAQYFTESRYINTIDKLKVNLNKTHNSETPLTDLCTRWESGNTHVFNLIRYLINRKDVDVNKVDRRGFAPLQYLFIYCDLTDKTLVFDLVNRGANYNVCDKKGQNVLYYMIRHFCFNHDYELENFKYLLLNSPIDVYHKDKEGKTILDVAEDRIAKEKKNYEDVKNYKSNWHYSITPDESVIKQAEIIRDMVKARLVNGV